MAGKGSWLFWIEEGEGGTEGEREEGRKRKGEVSGCFSDHSF